MSLLRLDIVKAAGHNIFFVMALPFMAYYGVKEYIRIVTGRDILPFFRFGTVSTVVIATLFLAFAVLRNIPVYPFTILAP